MDIYLYNPTRTPHFQPTPFTQNSQDRDQKKSKISLKATKYIRIFGLAFRILLHILNKNKSYEKIIITICCVINGIMYRTLEHKTPSKNHEEYFQTSSLS
jgi:hypothetical protein